MRVFVLFLFLSFNVFGQGEELSAYLNSFKNSGAGGFNKILIKGTDENNFTLFINCESQDKIVKNSGIKVNNLQLDNFIQKLNDIRIKFDDWVKISIENKIINVNKKMNIDFKIDTYFYFGSKLNFTDKVNLNVIYKVYDDNEKDKFVLFLYTDKIISENNNFMTTDGLAIVFKSVYQIDDLIRSISIENIKEYFKKKSLVNLLKD